MMAVMQWHAQDRATQTGQSVKETLQKHSADNFLLEQFRTTETLLLLTITILLGSHIFA
jgi:hypothetical protein